MRLMVTKRGFSLLVGAFLALALAACSGSGSGVKTERDDALANLDAANARIGSADDPMSLLGMLAEKTDEVMAATDELDAANARIGSADDPMSLLGMLAEKTDEVTGLETEVTDLMADVRDLMAALGDETNPDPASVRGMLAAKVDELAAKVDELAAANARIGSADDPASLLGMLDAEQTKASDLTELLRIANARIKALEEGTASDQLELITDAASAAVMTANTAATAAATAASVAEDADDNRATIQTGEANSVSDAKMARDAAVTAMAEAAKALAASDAAMAAGDVDAANTERDKAVLAMGAAMTAQTDAEAAMNAAVADSMVELKIDATVKSVGTVMVDLMAGKHTETINDETRNTGKVDDITATSEEVMGVMDDSDTTDVVETKPGVAGGRDVEIGLVVDSDEDDARVALIKSYIGERTVGAYTDESGSTRTATKPGVVSFDNDNDPDTLESYKLRSAGQHFLVDNLNDTGRIAAETEKGIMVFSYTYEDDQGTDQTEYVRHSMTVREEVDGDTTTTITYQRVNVVKGIKLPHGTDYDYIHFGVWASLGKNDDDTGDQEVSELGIAFVQDFEDAGMTEEMPNNGDGEYEGNWVANIQEADEDGDGAVRRGSGVATMMADFRKGEVTVDLMGLAMLEADITESTFAGAEAAKVDAANVYGVDEDGTFTGTVNGAFFGDDAAEAGGVFDYMSKDAEEGAFRGAFGSRRTDD